MNKIKEFYILNVYYKYPIFQKRLYFIFKIDQSYYRLTTYSGLNIKKRITTDTVKQILSLNRSKIYLFSRPKDEKNKRLDIKEIIPFVRLQLIEETNYSLREIILRNGL